MKLTLPTVLLSFAALLSGCGNFSSDQKGNDSEGDSSNTGKGCIQGVVTNGMTGQRHGLVRSKAAGSEQGVFVLVRNKMMLARTHVSDPQKEDANQNLQGEYHLCGVPLDEEFPIFVWQDGFLSFEGKISVDSTIAQRTPNSEVEDIPLLSPTTISDIQIFPIGAQAQDLRFSIVSSGKPVKGAIVQLKPTGHNFLDDSRTLANQIRLAPLSLTSSDAGEVIFKGEKLVLGGVYEYTILPPAGGSHNRAIKSAPVTVGLRASNGTALSHAPYKIEVALDDTVKRPELLMSSLEIAEVNSRGDLVLWFDSDVELTPGAAKAMGASLGGAVQAKLSSGPISKVLNVSSGRKIVITPQWATMPDGAKDKGLSITYSGLVFRPKGETRSEFYTAVDPLTVRIFDHL